MHVYMYVYISAYNRKYVLVYVRAYVCEIYMCIVVHVWLNEGMDN